MEQNLKNSVQVNYVMADDIEISCQEWKYDICFFKEISSKEIWSLEEQHNLKF